MEAKLMRELRRKKQELSLERTEQILKSCTHGVLGVIGDGGYPYTVPMSYAYHDKKIYLHCAKAGHKLDAVKNDGRVSFCAVARDDVLEAVSYTHLDVYKRQIWTWAFQRWKEA